MRFDDVQKELLKTLSSGAATPKSLRSKMDVPPGRLSAAIDSLGERGAVEMNSSRSLSLTPQGQRYVRQLSL